MSTKSKLITLPLLFITVKFFSQSFSAHPPHLHWQKLETEKFNLFFPEAIKSSAIDISNTILSKYNNDSALGKKVFKINIVLQNQTTVSNGYVGLPPFISEFYLTPPHDPYVIGTSNWNQALAIHEYRHVVQAMNSRKGINKLLYNVFGEEFWGGSYGMVVPNWFSEGDAVYAETFKTNAGRGRMANFSMPYRSLSNYARNWNYTQVRNGSFKKLVPNQYTYGYPMVKYIYDHFGDQAWNKIYSDAVKYKHKIFPFKSSIKSNTGLRVKELYKITKSELTLDSLINNDEKIASNNSNIVIRNYKTPYRVKDGYVLYLETSRDKLPTFILDHNGKKKNLIKLGLSNEIEFGYAHPLITFTRTTTDSRWDNKDYSDIWSYNLITNVTKRLTRKQKYFNPTPSPDATKIACVEYTPGGETKTIVINTVGEIIQKFNYPAGTQISFPTFSSDGNTIYSVLRDHGTSSIIEQSLPSNSYVSISAPINALISNLFIQHDTLYFSSDLSGIDNIYATKIGSYQYFQITQDQVGIQQFSINGDEILYNLLSARGIEIRSKRLSDCTFIKINDFKLKELDQKLESRANTSTENYSISRAGLLNNKFKVYAWGWNPQEGPAAFAIKGRNVLNTISGSLNYLYQNSEGSNTFNFETSSGSAYPVTSIVGGTTTGRHLSKRSDPTKDSIRWNETFYRLGLNIPWHWIYQNSNLHLVPYISFGAYLPNYTLGERVNYQRTFSMRSGIRFINQQAKTSLQVSSRWMQYLDFQINQGLNNKASAFNLLSEFHIPGLLKTHAIEFFGEYNYQSLKDPYRFSNRARFIHGYRAFSSDRTAWFRVAYHLPLIYPDFGIDGIAFLKRIRSRIFFESSANRIVGATRTLNINYQTVGTEMILDLQLFNSVPGSFGLRINNPLDTDRVNGKKRASTEFFIDSFF